MLVKGSLESKLKVYKDEMDACRKARTFWALLHVVVCLPDICAALQSDDGRTSSKRYKDWCREYYPDPSLTPDEVYGIRCKVLHEGRSSAVPPARYAGYAFSQPTGRLFTRLWIVVLSSLT